MVNEQALKINRYNCFCVYTMFILTMIILFITINDTSALPAIFIGYTGTILRICDYFRHIEVEFNKADDLPRSCNRRENLIKISGLLNIHNILVVIILYFAMITYWIYCFRYMVINVSYPFIKLYIFVFSIIYTIIVVKKTNSFMRCITRFQNTMEGIINIRLKGFRL